MQPAPLTCLGLTYLKGARISGPTTGLTIRSTWGFQQKEAATVIRVSGLFANWRELKEYSVEKNIFCTLYDKVCQHNMRGWQIRWWRWMCAMCKQMEIQGRWILRMHRGRELGRAVVRHWGQKQLRLWSIWLLQHWLFHFNLCIMQVYCEWGRLELL